MEANPRPLSPLASKILITGFLGGLALLSYLFTAGNPKGMASLRVSQDEMNAFYTCIEVLSGDTFVVEKSSSEEPPMTVHLIGIKAPPLIAGPELDAFGKAVGKSSEELLNPPDISHSYGEVARRTLKGFLLRQNIKLEFPDPKLPMVYVDCSGTEVSRKILREGQAIVNEAGHPRREDYLSCEAEGREKGFGIWR